MMTTITLPPGTSAEPNTCGSCKFFRRTDASYADVYRDRGWCQIRLPPLPERYQPLAVSRDTEEGDSWGPRARTDDMSCDLYRHSGETYVVQRIIKP